MTWEELKSDCLTCTKCDLCETRANVVFGDGVADAEVLFIGEGLDCCTFMHGVEERFGRTTF